MRLPRRICAARAQSIAEFALTLPLLLALLAGIIELGILLNVYIGLTNSAREAARAGAIYQEREAVLSVSDLPGDDRDVPGMDSRRLLSVSNTITATLNPVVNTLLLTPTIVYSPTTPLETNPYRAGDLVTVQLNYTHTLFFGVLGRHEITLSASSSMRIEPGGALGGTP